MLQLTGSEISPPLVVVIWERCYRSWWWIHMTKQNLKKINSLEQFWYEGWIRQVNQANAFFWNRETDPFMSYYIQIIRSQPSIKLGRQSEGKRSCNDTRWFRRQNRRKWQRLRAGYGQTWFGGDEREWRKLCRLLRRLQPCHQRKPVPTQGSPRGNMDITWPNNRKSIDHICISPQFRRSLLHVRVKRGADAASDHHLRVARVRLKLRRNYKPRNLRIKDNVHYHKDNDTVQSFWVSLSYRIQPLQDLSMGDLSMGDEWHQREY